jgi:hypothetical protein
VLSKPWSEWTVFLAIKKMIHACKCGIFHNNFVKKWFTWGGKGAVIDDYNCQYIFLSKCFFLKFTFSFFNWFVHQTIRTKNFDQ